MVAMSYPPAGKRRHLTSSPFASQVEREIETYAVGERVTHDSFGLGRVVATYEGIATVDFGTQTVRVFSPYAKMQKL